MKKAVMKTLGLLGGAMLLAGCIGPSGVVGELPPIASDEMAGEIYVVRNSNPIGGAQNYGVTLDSKEVFGIGVREYTKFKVSAGEHKVGVSCTGGWGFGKRFDEKPVIIKPGKPHYFLARAGGACAVIVPLSEDLAFEYLEKAKYIPFERE